MDELQIHLLFNHVPVIGTLAALLVVIIGLVMKINAVRMTGLAVYVAMALAVVPTYLTGEGAEDRVENIAGVSENVIESHEDMAQLSLWIILATAAIACIALFTQWKAMSLAPLISTLFVVIALGASIQIGLTANEGGKIRRPDLGSQPAIPVGAETGHKD